MKEVIVIKKLSFLLMFVMFFITSNLSISASGFGFTRNNDNLPPSIGSYQKIFKETGSIYVGDTNKKNIYLTFDAGYDNGELPKILDVLSKYNIKASFFLTGDFVNRYQDLVIRMTLEGHAICNHTYSHKNISLMDLNTLEDEITKVESAYYDITGCRMLRLVRPPEGEFDLNSLRNVNKLGYRAVFWSSACVDWKVDSQNVVEYTKNIFVNNLHNGAIILMHSVSSSNREALPSIIEESLKQGYTFSLLTDFENG